MRDIIFILCDTLRYDYVTPDITPNIWNYGRKGVFFTDCWSGNTETKRSLPWLLCGREIYSPTSNIMGDLKKYGYKSFLVHTNPVIFPFEHGWGGVHYCEPPDTGIFRGVRDLYQKYSFVRKLYNLGEKIIPSLGTRYHCAFLPYTRAEKLLDVASTLLQKDRDHPYFLWVHLMDPHAPYIPRKTSYTMEQLEKIHNTKPESGRARKGDNPNTPVPTHWLINLWKTLYKQEIQELDELIGGFLSTLDGDEIIIITADHGEEFGEHGGFGHGASKFVPELQHVPLIVMDGKRTGEYDHRFDHKDMGILIQELVGMIKR